MTHYTTKLFIITACLLTLIAGFNWLANPYLLFNSPDIEGFNKIKTEPFYKQLVFKPYQIKSQPYRTVIFGSSRAGIALDPEQLPDRYQPAYNASIGGATSYINYRLLQQSLLQKNQAPEHVILETAFFSFNRFSQMNTPERDPLFENRIQGRYDGSSNPFFLPQKTFDYFVTLLSWDSVRASLRMLSKQQSVAEKQRGSFIQKNNGQWLQQAPPKQFTSTLYDGSLEKFLYKEWFPAPKKAFQLQGKNDKANKPLLYYRQSLRTLYEHNIHTSVVILPVHSNLLVSLEQSGLQAKFEKWKRQLVNINQEEAKRAKQTPFSIWDFAFAHPQASEAVPLDQQSHQRLQWFNDSAHPSPLFGNQVMQQIVENKKSNAGYAITEENIEQKLMEQKHLLQRYKKQHPEQIENINRIINKAPAGLPYKS